MRLSNACYFALSALLLAGCVGVPYPEKSAVEAQAGKIPILASADDARSYIATIRKDMVAERSRLSAFELATDGGIAYGVGRSILGGALHWAGSTIIRATFWGGASLALSDAVQPRAQIATIDRGLDALHCIEGVGEATYPRAAQVDLILANIKIAMNNLSDVSKQSGVSQEKLTLARQKLSNASSFIVMRSPPIYQQMRLAADAVITTTNTQLHAATSDPDAIHKALVGMTLAPPTLNTTPNTTVDQTGPIPRKGKAPADAAGGPPPTPPPCEADCQIDLQIGALDGAIIAATIQLNALGLVDRGPDPDFSACTPQAVLLTLDPSGPITLSAKQSYSLSVGGGVPRWYWQGPVPSDAVLKIVPYGSNVFMLTTGDSVKSTDHFALVFSPVGDNGPKKTVTISFSDSH
ncbi:hypothetical protein VPG91_11550 [Nitrospirillum amazonense]|uniref:hypothetical protein n=1 Tax=Nitrospirillum amazonense TaxID=28077 RepID=UPI002DD42987|nr:hypothetical protein [Nitrospirillum amazonense]MEC4591624.1 hypothetical protein [Nitrospirillum amazonense]